MKQEQEPKIINVKQSLPIPIYEILKFTTETQIGYPVLAGGYCANILGLTSEYGDVDLYIFVSQLDIVTIHDFMTGEYLTNTLKNVGMFIISSPIPGNSVNEYRCIKYTRLRGIKRIYNVLTKEVKAPLINPCDIILVNFSEYSYSLDPLRMQRMQLISEYLHTCRRSLPSPDVLDVSRCIFILINEFDLDVCRCVAIPHHQFPTLYMKVFDLRMTFRHPLYEAINDLMFFHLWSNTKTFTRLLKYISRTAIWSIRQFEDITNSTHFIRRLETYVRCILHYRKRGDIEYNPYYYSFARQKYFRNHHYQVHTDRLIDFKQQKICSLIERDFPTIISNIYKYSIKENVGAIFLAGIYCANLLGLSKYSHPVNVFWIILNKGDKKKIYKFLERDASKVFIRCYKNPIPFSSIQNELREHMFFPLRAIYLLSINVVRMKFVLA